MHLEFFYFLKNQRPHPKKKLSESWWKTLYIDVIPTGHAYCVNPNLRKESTITNLLARAKTNKIIPNYYWYNKIRTCVDDFKK